MRAAFRAGIQVARSAVAKSKATALATSTTTNSEGLFGFAQLIPGKYTLSIESSGFKKKSVTDIDVKLGDTSLGNISVEVGSPTESVTVTGEEEAILSRDQSMISANFNERKVVELVWTRWLCSSRASRKTVAAAQTRTAPDCR